jgi:hypothetical protein
MSGLPDPVTREQQYMRALCDRIDAQNELLGQIRDRLPEPAHTAPPKESTGPTVVELREPAERNDAQAGDDASTQAPRPAARRSRTTSSKAKPKGSS